LAANNEERARQPVQSVSAGEHDIIRRGATKRTRRTFHLDRRVSGIDVNVHSQCLGQWNQCEKIEKTKL